MYETPGRLDGTIAQSGIEISGLGEPVLFIFSERPCCAGTQQDSWEIRFKKRAANFDHSILYQNICPKIKWYK